MDEQLKPLNEWLDNPHICYALDRIRAEHDPVASLVEALVEVAKCARYAEDFMLIHKFKCPPACSQPTD